LIFSFSLPLNSCPSPFSEIDFLFSLENYCPVGIIGADGSIYLEPKREFEKELYVLTALTVLGKLIFYG